MNKSLSSLVARPMFWLSLLVVLFALPIACAVSAPPPKLPEALYPLPEFSLTNEQNQPFGLAQMKGHVSIVNFIFTSCQEACPRLTAEMAKVQQRTRGLGDSIRLVSISVDPKNDKPEVLAAYAQKAGAIPGRWVFLTGDQKAVEAAVTEGFKVAMGDDLNAYHGEKLVLVDKQGQIRGYYDATPEGESALVHDAGLLANL